MALLIELTLLIGAGYLLLGAIFAVVFVRSGAARLDEAAHNVSLPTRVLWFPGAVLLWPVLLRALSTAAKRLNL